MPKSANAQTIATLLTAVLFVWACGPAAAAVRIEGQVQGGGGPIAKSTVTLWAASANAPAQLAQVKTDANGGFEIAAERPPGDDTILYLVAKGGQPTANKAGGDNPAIALMTVVGSKPPAKVIDQRDDDRRIGVDHTRSSSTAPRSRATRSACRLPRATCPTSSISRPAAGAAPSRTRSTAARRRRWPTSPRWPTCLPAASRG